MLMKFTIEDKVFEKYPDAVIGVIVARNIDNSGKEEEIIEMLRSEEKKLRIDLDLDKLAEYDFIKCWREAYKKFGEKKDRSSSEALIRRVLKGDNIPPINKLVDIYNYISIKYRTPVGGEDLDKIKGDIFLKISNGSDKFTIIGSREDRPPFEGEIVYADGEKVICRKWNWRESDDTKVTEHTKNAFLVIDSIAPFNSMNQALEEFENLVKKFCGANTVVFILDKNKRFIDF